MQVGIHEVVNLFLGVLVFLSGCFFKSVWKNRLMLGLMIAMPLYGCAAGQVVVASHDDESANCVVLEKELGVAQARMQTLQTTDSTKRNIRNFLFGAAGLVVPPLTLINVVLFLNDSYAADYTEEKTLKTRYNNMVMISQGQGCGTKYALIPVKEEGPKA